MGMIKSIMVLHDPSGAVLYVDNIDGIFVDIHILASFIVANKTAYGEALGEKRFEKMGIQYNDNIIKLVPIENVDAFIAVLSDLDDSYYVQSIIPDLIEEIKKYQDEINDFKGKIEKYNELEHIIEDCYKNSKLIGFPWANPKAILKLVTAG